MWESKTIMACASALAAAMMAITGHYTGTDPMTDSGLYSAWISTVASVLGILFRMNAKHVLTLGRPIAPEEPEEKKTEPDPSPVEPDSEETTDDEDT